MIVYKITNTINNKVYIGQTINSLESRWKCHLKKSSKSLLVSRAIQKYGKENFTIEQIDSSETLDELNQKEIYWISFYQSTDVLKGYNIMSGGRNALLTDESKLKISIKKKGQRHTEETKRQMSESRKGRIFSEETRKKISDSHKGKIVSSETKRKISEANLGRKHTEQSKENMKIGLSSLETREKMRNNNLGKKLSEETKRKISLANTGRVCSEETRKKIGNANRKEVSIG